MSVHSTDARHRIRVAKADAAGAHGVAAHIESRLEVECYVSSLSPGEGWAIDWTGPKDVDLDFLRPFILPPIGATSVRPGT